MANIDITDAGASLSNGLLQLENGVAMDTTLRYVADQLNTKSQLLLATNATTVEGTLKIKTSNVEYLDVEDALGNNRFTISKAVGSQKVDLDFASNPTGSTTIVGAIRTYQDGINLSDTMVFREDGHVGIGAASPAGLLHVNGGANVARMILDADTNLARIFSFRTANSPRWAFRIDGNETGTNAGSDFAIRRYNDAGTFVDAPMVITRSSGNIGVNTTTTTAAKLTLKGTGSTSATTSLQVQNSAGNASLQITDDGSVFNYGKGLVSSNTVFGKSALSSNTNGSNNTAFGESALTLNTTGSSNTAIGYLSCLLTSTGGSNTAVGSNSLRVNTTGSGNTAIGTSALFTNVNGSNNTGIGNGCFPNNQSGSNNTAIGVNSLVLSTGNSNSALGVDTRSNSYDSCVLLGRSAQATASNQFVVGSAAYNAGAITSETVVSDATWTVVINGVQYKVLLKA